MVNIIDRKFLVTALALMFLLVGAAAAFAGGDCLSGKKAAAEKMAAAQAPTSFDAPQAPGTMATCPVMGGSFTITEKTDSAEHNGQYVYFCCPGCVSKFEADPEAFLNKATDKVTSK
ncbi:MAG: hypothetical protein P9L99_03615 [Candidatus Lernaella stagnicola]|nr:hypothetical protein [Candidatus Lernaella stagnicola]